VIDEARRALVPAGHWLSQIAGRVFLRCEMSGIRRRLSHSMARHRRVGQRSAQAPAALRG
jgi:hypothetical protein